MLDEFEAAVERSDRSVVFDGDRPRFVLRSDMFRRSDLDRLFGEARRLRAWGQQERTSPEVARLREVLHHRRVLLLFAQPSTRTSESFAAAAERLGGTVRVVSDLDATSFTKGESVEDAAQVFACGYDAIVVRHPDSRFALRLAHGLYRGPRSVPVISGGSGTREHPTQGLLDVFTLQDAWPDGLAGKRLVIVGDAARNRTARSLASLLTRFEGVSVHFVCPEAHRPEAAFVAALRAGGLEVTVGTNLRETLQALGPSIDALYMTRLQQEWDTLPWAGGEGVRGTAPDLVLHPEYRSVLSERCKILHPLPRVNELPSEWDAHPGFLVWQQVYNGMWVRAALLAQMLSSGAA